MSEVSAEQIGETIVKQAADYVARTQPLLDEVETKKAAWNHQVTKTAAVLAHRGCLDQNKVTQFTDKLAEDPCNALIFLEKLAKSLRPDDLGQPSEKVAHVVTGKEAADPFVQEFCPEYVR